MVCGTPNRRVWISTFKGMVAALDRHGKPFELRVDGLLATCVQHEVDHLDGKLFIDHLSALKRDRAIKKYDKLHKQGDVA